MPQTISASENFDWTRGVVAILDGRSKAVGTGFVVSADPFLIVTCAHVLVESVGWPYQSWMTPITIRLRIAGQARRRDAYVQANWFEFNEDVAILKVDGDLPAGVNPLPLAHARGGEQAEVVTLGHPEAHDELLGLGKVLGLVGQDGFERLQMRSEEMTKGYSGGPVWHSGWKRVIGMVQGGKPKADAQGRLGLVSFAVPAQRLVKICDQLALSPPPTKVDVRREEIEAEQAANLGIARRRYLERLRLRCNALPLAALGSDDGAGEAVSLEQVYVALDVRAPAAVTDEAKKAGVRSWGSLRSALDTVAAARRVVLLGDPGSGKTSFVKYLSAWLAAVELGEKGPPPGMGPVLPLFMNLRELAPRLRKLELDGLPDDDRDRQLRAAVVAQWRADLQEMGADALAANLGDELVSGAVLLIFDGLDEVADQVRGLVPLAVAAVLREYRPVQHVIVTCRIRSYTKSAKLPGFHEETLAPFDGDKIRYFVKVWYDVQTGFGRLTHKQADEKAADLSRAATEPALIELAANPMLLTTMAIIHQREVGLPRERARLYAQAVDVLLNRWQRRIGVEVSPLLAALLDDKLKLRQMMNRLGYEAQQIQGDKGTEADLSRWDILKVLGEGYGVAAGVAEELLDYVDQRAGLLVGRGGDRGADTQSYGFPHRTFQEYLAGCHLAAGRARDSSRLYLGRAADGEYWSLAAQLGAEDLLYNAGQPTQVLDLAYRLCRRKEPETTADWRAIVWSGHMAALLGERVIAADDEEGGGRDFLARLIRRLEAVLSRTDLTTIDRFEAGKWLAELGDPRPGVCTLAPDMCPVIQAGTITLRATKGAQAYGAFRIARYPVTNWQYRQFVEDGGYTERQRQCWSDEGWQQLGAKGWTGPRWWRDEDEWKADNRPIIGVSWHEANAYASWLSQKTGATYRLPTEAEWERAAGHTDGRDYPWGAWAEGHANTKEAGLGQTSAVGMFPEGAAVNGAMDMSGNVWEWCLDWYDDDKVARVLRGGTWDNGRNLARVAFRDFDLPVSRDYYVGFRLVTPVPGS